MPLIRRIPKRGFNNARHATFYIPISIESLNPFENGAKVDLEAFRQAGLANGPSAGVKILGDRLAVMAASLMTGSRVSTPTSDQVPEEM